MSYQVKLINQINQIGPNLWQRFFADAHPFHRYAFLAALEESGCVGPGTGWQPLHLQFFQGQQCIGLLPAYLKAHSYGEYIFDWAWAEAYQQHGLAYYPKLVTAIPFSPVTGKRFASTLSDDAFSGVLNQALDQLCQQQRWSSWHGLFTTAEQTESLRKQGFIPRYHWQYHWRNQQYQSFDHYLQALTARKRKMIRRERQRVADQGITLSTVEGPAITTGLLTHFYQCYTRTHQVRNRQGYLNLAFFRTLVAEMPEQLVLFCAKQNNQLIACALCLKSATHLYGRYWGSLIEANCLHFETCYYQGIEYCIAQGLAEFDPGAQGEHKIARGFAPTPTFSCHSIQHPAFADAVRMFCQEEQLQAAKHMQALSEQLPFKHS